MVNHRQQILDIPDWLLILFMTLSSFLILVIVEIAPYLEDRTPLFLQFMGVLTVSSVLLISKIIIHKDKQTTLKTHNITREHTRTYNHLQRRHEETQKELTRLVSENANLTKYNNLYLDIRSLAANTTFAELLSEQMTSKDIIELNDEAFARKIIKNDRYLPAIINLMSSHQYFISGNKYENDTKEAELRELERKCGYTSETLSKIYAGTYPKLKSILEGVTYLDYLKYTLKK